MRADTYILLIYLSLAIFGDAEKNESAFVATHEWQTVKKGEFQTWRAMWDYFTSTESVFFQHHVSQIRRVIFFRGDPQKRDF